jgi:hypothetical protein
VLYGCVYLANTQTMGIRLRSPFETADPPVALQLLS